MTVKIKEWKAERYLKLLEGALRSKLIAIGRDIANDAKSYVNVDTGRLRSSITVNYDKSTVSRAKPTENFTRGSIINLYNTRVSDRDRESIENDGVGRPSKEPNKITVVVGTNVRYAPFQEFGLKGKPYLRPAYRNQKAKLGRLGANIEFFTD